MPQRGGALSWLAVGVQWGSGRRYGRLQPRRSAVPLSHCDARACRKRHVAASPRCVQCDRPAPGACISGDAGRAGLGFSDIMELLLQLLPPSPRRCGALTLAAFLRMASVRRRLYSLMGVAWTLHGLGTSAPLPTPGPVTANGTSYCSMTMMKASSPQKRTRCAWGFVRARC
jgi:hypothetical protein